MWFASLCDGIIITTETVLYGIWSSNFGVKQMDALGL